MLLAGTDLSFIVRVTKLSFEQIKQLQKLSILKLFKVDSLRIESALGQFG